MQFHLNGFRAGDPDIKTDPTLPEAGDEVDVLIVGCGPAGLTLAAQLSAFPSITTRIVERRDGPLERGHADGISVRSMEMFEAFGFAHRVKREAYWVNQTTFWKPSDADPSNIVRTGRVQDVEDGLSHMPHVILNQARVHDMYLEMMENAPRRLTPDYGLSFKGLEVGDGPYPVTVTLQDAKGETRYIRARYVVGCDGARSGVRDAIGRTMNGDFANKAWGVMDVLTNTDFPDIRFKCLIQSAGHGNIVLIPREGGYLVRFYIELDELAPDERVRSRNITSDDLIAAANRIIHPYALDVKEVAWWSVYEIGQRLTDRFDNLPDGAPEDAAPHVFIAGDACHTHSPKAGQGMNVSMGDAFNLGWKLAAVLKGLAPESLLRTYSEERQGVAQDLIDFDKEWTKVLTARDEGEDTPKFQKYFIEHGRYTAGTAVRYAPSSLTADQTHQGLAPGFEIGMRLHSAPVVRVADARELQLGQTIDADGRWRVFAFEDAGGEKLQDCLKALEASLPLLGGSGDPDAAIDLRAILQRDWDAVLLSDLPDILFPKKGKLGLTDPEKVFARLKSADIFEQRGIDREGCLLVVRPDQYVAALFPLDRPDALIDFFKGIFTGSA